MNIKYNTPIEVTEDQYNRVARCCGTIAAHRIFKGKYYIKLWVMGYKQELINALNDRAIQTKQFKIS